MITILIGDLFKSTAQTLVNTVNCVGVMGKGIAKVFKKKYPDMFREYKHLCQTGSVKLGKPYLYHDLFGTSILNFPTKSHWRTASRLQDIEEGLDFFCAKYKSWGIQSIAFPPLGCGNGGLDWADVGPLLYTKLANLDISVEIYAPYGTSANQLSLAFLSQLRNTPENLKGIYHPKLRTTWLPLLEVVYQLNQQPYANPVGRTIFQKISYIMTEAGLDTGFQFEQGNYGPFSPNVQQALTIYANANLIQEKQLGRMTALIINGEYQKKRQAFKKELSVYQHQINKTVDLFSRIKSTAQAEEVTTVLFVARKLKQERGDDNVSEQEIYDYILQWKKKWQTDEKQRTIISTIRNLQVLNWVRLQYSESLPYDSSFA